MHASFGKQKRESTKDGYYCFAGQQFPEDPDGKYFDRITFKDIASFRGATFEGEVDFSGVVFEGDADFSGATFEGEVDFIQATFIGKGDFSGTTFEKFTDFAKTEFHALASFPLATFKSFTNFTAATFKSEAYFMGAVFKGFLLFDEATFKAEADFNLVKADVHIQFDLPSSSLLKWKSKPFEIGGEGETAYRLAKQVAQRNGDYRTAGVYHYAEQCAINSGQLRRSSYNPLNPDFYKRQKNPLWAWGEFFIGRLLFGYGEKPIRVFLIGIVFIVALAAIYCLTGGILSDGQEACFHAPLTALYFSVVTFTTLGYGDLKPIGWVRLLAAGEALSGAAIMALFIVSLARKFTR